jgi:hypothetical protein
MRRPFVSVCAALLVSGVVTACGDGLVVNFDGDVFSGVGVDGSGTIVTEAREVGDFNRINLKGEGTVVVTEGREASLTIETDDNLLTHIDTSVTDGTLEITTESGIDIDPTDTVVYEVAVPNIVGLTLAGAGRIRLGECRADSFAINLSGAGDIEIGALTTDALNAAISGVGSIVVAGTAESQVVTVSGAGSYEAADLQSVRATVTNSGVGSAAVWVTESLDVTVSGLGSIDYFGSPEVTKAVSGIGTVSARGDR